MNKTTEDARRLRDALVTHLREPGPRRDRWMYPGTITYQDIWRAAFGSASYAHNYTGQLLHSVADGEHANGRPMITALVVQKQTLTPGPEFAEAARRLGHDHPTDPSAAAKAWAAHVDEAVRYWRRPDVLIIADMLSAAR